MRQQLGLPVEASIIAMLPGSRLGEVSRLAQDFIETARWCLARNPDLHFIVPFATARTRQHFEQILQSRSDAADSFTLVDGHSRNAMGAADAVLLASGTATLEALLLQRPMLIAYRLSPMTYMIAKRLLKVPYYSLPNNLAGKRLVEEITQDEVRAEILGPRLMVLLNDSSARDEMLHQFAQIRHRLTKNSSEQAARAIIELVRRNNG